MPLILNIPQIHGVLHLIPSMFNLYDHQPDHHDGTLLQNRIRSGAEKACSQEYLDKEVTFYQCLDSFKISHTASVIISNTS